MKFATQDDVTSRFEGTIAPDRLAWVDVRLEDVENALMGAVPELRRPESEIQARAVARGDESYLDRVKALVCDKVLQLYRNPEGITQKSLTVDDVQETWSLARSSQATISFTADELSSVRFSGCGTGSVRLVAYPEHRLPGYLC